MSDADQSYFKARAEQELRLAEEALDSCAAHAHSRLAGLYLDRIGVGALPTSSDNACG